MKKLSYSFIKGFRTVILLVLLAFFLNYANAQQTVPAAPQAPTAPQTPTAPIAPRAPVDSTIRMTHYQTEIWDPQLQMIQPGEKAGFWDAPSDAIILFDGTDINKEWEESARGVSKPAVSWVIKDGAMESVQGSGSVKTKRKFTDFQLHIEWRTPSLITGKGQDRGNSGVYIQDFYELQILDSWYNRTYKNGQAGAFYKQYAPLVNSSRKPGEWQSYDIIYTAPRFGKDSTTYFTPPRVTVFQNGVLIQNNVALHWSDNICWDT